MLTFTSRSLEMWKFSESKDDEQHSSCLDYGLTGHTECAPVPISIRVWGIIVYFDSGLSTTFC